ncbi:(2Fe-2S)-binding protein [Candidatus Sodalis endolongispinus]|uniref:(2Fe-2S)-binding protein n=1 Tax=Candidatus Sodalis endolongispinus TaxID=2812662 RepID=UPI0035E41D6E
MVDAFSRVPPPEDRLALLAGQQASGETAGRTICSCYGVGEQQIRRAIDEGCNTVDALGKRLRCGTNCGSCIPELKQLLARQQA